MQQVTESLERMRELLEVAEYDNANAAHAIDEALKLLEKIQMAADDKKAKRDA